MIKKVEYNVGKEGNAAYMHFLLFSQCFHQSFAHRLLKFGKGLSEMKYVCKVKLDILELLVGHLATKADWLHTLN